MIAELLFCYIKSYIVLFIEPLRLSKRNNLIKNKNDTQNFSA